MASAEARLDLTIARFRRALTRARFLLLSFGRSGLRVGLGLGRALFGGVIGAALRFGRIISILAASITALAATAGGALAAGLVKAFDAGSRLSDVASQIGATAGEVLTLEEAFRQAGVSAEKVPTSVSKLQRSILEATEGLTTYERAFEGIGLDPEKLLGGDPVQVFETVARAIAAIEDPTERTGRAMQIFGRSGGELLTLFNDAQGFEKARVTLGRQAEVIQDAAGDFDRASDILNSIFVKVRGFFIGFGARLVDQILPALEAFNQIDLTGIGESLGEGFSGAIDFVTAAIETLSLDEIFELAGLTLELGFRNAVNFLSRAFAALVDVLGGPGTWAILTDRLLEAAEAFKKEMLGVLALLGESVTLESRSLSVERDPNNLPRRRELRDGRLTEVDELTGEKRFLGRFPNAPEGASLFDLDALSGSAGGGLSGLVSDFDRAFKSAEGILGSNPELEKRLGELRDTVEAAAEENKQLREEQTKNRRAAQQAGKAAAAESSSATAGGGVRLAGAFQRAVNLLGGRTVNELIADETLRGNELLEKIREASNDQTRKLRDIERQLANPSPVDVEVEVTPTFGTAPA